MARLFRGNREHLLRRIPKNLRSAEIGVHNGYYSSLIFKYVEPAHHIMIDPWELQSQRVFPHGIEFGDQEKFDERYELVKRRFSLPIRMGVGSVVREMSNRALAGIPENSLDWVYIDGNHRYFNVMEDLLLSARAVKPEGFIAGHDYAVAPKRKTLSVVEALTNFLHQHNDWILLLRTWERFGTFVIVRRDMEQHYNQIFFRGS